VTKLGAIGHEEGGERIKAWKKNKEDHSILQLQAIPKGWRKKVGRHEIDGGCY